MNETKSIKKSGNYGMYYFQGDFSPSSRIVKKPEVMIRNSNNYYLKWRLVLYL